MDVRKTVIGGLCCLAILGGVNYLLNQYGNAGIAIASDVSTSSLGGARQFVGKLDIKSSPYFAQPDIYNMHSNNHLIVLSHYKTKQQNDGYIGAMGTGSEKEAYKQAAFAKLIAALEEELEDEA